MENFQSSLNETSQEPINDHSATQSKKKVGEESRYESSFEVRFKKVPPVEKLEGKISNLNITELSASDDSFVWNVSNAVNITNNAKALMSFIKNVVRVFWAKNSIRGKCVEHIYIEGFLKSGKTTLARTVMPYLISLELLTAGIYSKFNVIYVDVSVFNLQNSSNSIDFRTWLLEQTTGEVVDDIFVLGNIQRVQHLFRKTFSDNKTLNFIVVDEIQLLSRHEMEWLMRYFKSLDYTFSDTPPNYTTIWTGSTLAQIFKVMNGLPSNGFDIKDSQFTYSVPYDCGIESLKECLCYLRKHGEGKIFTSSQLAIIRNVFGVIHWSILSQLYVLMQGTSLEQAIHSLVEAYFNIYDRDVKTTLEETDSSNLICLFWSTLSPDDMRKDLSNPNLVDTFFVLENGGYRLRDIMMRKVSYIRSISMAIILVCTN